jgi:hypothetical protein
VRDAAGVVGHRRVVIEVTSVLVASVTQLERSLPPEVVPRPRDIC